MEQLLGKPEEVLLLLQMLMPNGNVLLASSSYLRHCKRQLDTALSSK